MAQVDDSRLRLQWRTNSKVEIYSNSRNRWFTGSVVRVFTDDEGEWLEIRYDNTMSKQVQRYSSDIRPVQDEDEEDTDSSPMKTDNNPPAPATPGNLPFSADEMKTRQDWKQDDPVQIYSNTNKEWYDGKIVDIVRDDEGEWLNVIWERVDGEAMSKQVQRFSTDIRPGPQKKRQTTSKKSKSNARANSGGRRAPRFSRSIPSSTHTYPATSQYRRIQKLTAIVEEDRTSTSPTLISAWGSADIAAWLETLGNAYARYKEKFVGWDGDKLSRVTEDQLMAMKIPKLHRCKILLEVSRYCNPDHSRLLEETQGVDVLGWDADDVSDWVKKQPLPLATYTNMFKDNGVDGILLFELDEEDLSDMEIRRNDRAKVLDMIQTYARTVFPDDDLDNYDNGDDMMENGMNDGLATVANGIPNGDSEAHRRGLHGRRGSVQMLVSSARSDDAVVELLCGVTAVLSKVATFGADIQSSVQELQRKADQIAAERGLNEQGNGHKRRQSLPLIANMAMIDERDEEDDSDELSDID